MMAKETDLEYVVRQLNDHKGMWLKSAKDANVSYSTVRLIASGDNVNPMLETLNKLVTYFKGKNK